MHILNTTGEVIWSCNVTAIEHEREKCDSSVFWKERLVCARSVTLLRESYFAWHRLGGHHADGKYEIPYVIGLSCGLPQFQHICLYFLFTLLLSRMYDFTPMIFTVSMWGFEVANSNLDRDTSFKYSTRGDVGMRCHHYWTRGWLYFVKHMLLRLVEIVGRSCKPPEAGNALPNMLVVLSTVVLTSYLSVLLMHIISI